MFAAIRPLVLAMVFCGAMTIVSCSSDDDNTNNEPTPPTPTPTEEEYKIVVGEGMVMPENAFLKVAAVAGDKNVINALNAIDKVTDVKAFNLLVGYDYWTAKVINKTAYYFNYKQDIDHNDPSKGWFKQQCVLTVAGQDRPTVLHTEGYSLDHTGENHLNSISEPMLVSVLDANCLQVEYRYHGWSLPEGYTNKWNYLTAKQHSADLHAIVTAIKQSGIVGNGKWLATGVSKNGMTTAHYAYHYPNEMDAYVPFCAPFLLEQKSSGPYSHLLTKDAFGEDEVRMNKVKTAFRTYCGNQKLQAQCVQIYRKTYPTVTDTDENIRMNLLHCLFEYYFAKMSYVPYKKWESMIPAEGDSAQKYYDFMMADNRTRYADETDDEYNRRQDTSDDLEPASDNISEPRFLTRGQATVERHNPYFVQVSIELGGYGYVTNWVSDLLSATEKEFLASRGTSPSTYGVVYDNGRFIQEFFEGMKQSNCHMMFVYGMQDPWTGGQIPDEKMGANSHKLFIQHPVNRSTSAGLHNDDIDQWNTSERTELFHWLAQLGFLVNE